MELLDWVLAPPFAALGRRDMAKLLQRGWQVLGYVASLKDKEVRVRRGLCGAKWHGGRVYFWAWKRLFRFHDGKRHWLI